MTSLLTPTDRLLHVRRKCSCLDGRLKHSTVVAFGRFSRDAGAASHCRLGIGGGFQRKTTLAWMRSRNSLQFGDETHTTQMGSLHSGCRRQQDCIDIQKTAEARTSVDDLDLLHTDPNHFKSTHCWRARWRCAVTVTDTYW